VWGESEVSPGRGSGCENPDLWGSTGERDFSPWRSSVALAKDDRTRRAHEEAHKLVTDLLAGDSRECAASGTEGSMPSRCRWPGGCNGGR
jgi:hypothetical protein